MTASWLFFRVIRSLKRGVIQALGLLKSLRIIHATSVDLLRDTLEILHCELVISLYVTFTTRVLLYVLYTRISVVLVSFLYFCQLIK